MTRLALVRALVKRGVRVPYYDESGLRELPPTLWLRYRLAYALQAEARPSKRLLPSERSRTEELDAMIATLASAATSATWTRFRLRFPSRLFQGKAIRVGGRVGARASAMPTDSNEP